MISSLENFVCIIQLSKNNGERAIIHKKQIHIKIKIMQLFIAMGFKNMIPKRITLHDISNAYLKSSLKHVQSLFNVLFSFS